MKKMIFGALALATISLAGCTSKEATADEQQPAQTEEQAYQVDVEAASVAPEQTPEGTVEDVATEVTLTPEETK